MVLFRFGTPFFLLKTATFLGVISCVESESDNIFYEMSHIYHVMSTFTKIFTVILKWVK